MAQTIEAIRHHGTTLALEYTPGADVDAGTVIQLGSNLTGVAPEALLANRLGALEAEGIFKVKKEVGGGVVFAAGDQVEWEDTAKEAVIAAGGDWDMGVAVFAALDNDDFVLVWLNKQL